jgi:glucose-1-phosphate cytidylyltransferase
MAYLPRMQVVILAGGLGTRLSEETGLKPKPMVDIGDVPMLRHIMTIYADQGHQEFLIALGYLGHVIKRYFMEEATTAGDLDVDLATGGIRRSDDARLPWRIRLIETGKDTQTGGRLRRLAQHLTGPFMLTYGDGVADVDLDAVLACHTRHGRLATITAVRPPARFGALEIDGERVASFAEKSQTSEGWINGGFMVLEPAVLEMIDGDATVLERDVLTRLAADGQLSAHRHDGFWHCMDTLRDVQTLRAYARTGKPPWRR